MKATSSLPPILEVSSTISQTGFADYLSDTTASSASFPFSLTTEIASCPKWTSHSPAPCSASTSTTSRYPNTKSASPRPNAPPIRIPVQTHQSSTLGPVGLVMSVPWFGPQDDWKTMFDFPRHAQPQQHISLGPDLGLLPGPPPSPAKPPRTSSNTGQPVQRIRRRSIQRILSTKAPI